ncbi:MAG: hypothetical protein IH835_08205 [Proteobacteria bacterium]|nr:hypothetical protein [Pseudomonadota bacterium]
MNAAPLSSGVADESWAAFARLGPNNRQTVRLTARMRFMEFPYRRVFQKVMHGAHNWLQKWFWIALTEYYYWVADPISE